MPAYNFKSQLARVVELGVKCQTIRRKRKNPTRVGDALYLYTGMRTGKCRLLRETVCTSVTPVEIGWDFVQFEGRKLSFEETLRLAQSDGFLNVSQFLEFFRKNYQLTPDAALLQMKLITWSTAS